MFSLAIYWGNCLLSILIAKLGLMINKEKTTILAIVSALPIFIITSIRYDVGSDYFSYRREQTWKSSLLMMAQRMIVGVCVICMQNSIKKYESFIRQMQGFPRPETQALK